MALVVVGYGLKIVVDFILTELVTAFARLSKWIGISPGN